VTRTLLDSARRAFAALDAGAPALGWWVPGRLEIFGKHTDYAGGRSLVAALPRGFVFLAAPRDDDQVVVPGEPHGPGVPGYAAVAARRLARNFPGSRRGATIVFASDLPRAAGMSSSSALVVGVAAALTRLWNLEARAEWQENIRDASDLATYYACIESGLTFGGLAGDGGVGTHGGSEDHAAIVLGKPGQISAYSFIPMRHLGDAPMPSGWRFVIASSGVAADKAGAARRAYNRLSRGAAILLELWNEEGAPCRSLAAALASSPAAPDRLRALIHGSAIPGWPPDALERRLAHFEIEDAFVPDALDAFRRADAGTLGALGDASQHRAEQLLGNQIQETIALARIAREGGAFAASSFGAGFGGSVWALVTADRADEFARQWLAEYRRQYPAAASAEAFTATPGPPLTELNQDGGPP
jgi:galactokinase